MFDAAVGVAHDPVEHLDDRAHVDVEAGFFADLARDRLLERLAELHACRPAGSTAP